MTRMQETKNKIVQVFGRQNSIFDRQTSLLHLWLFWPYLFIVFHRVATLEYYSGTSLVWART